MRDRSRAYSGEIRHTTEVAHETAHFVVLHHFGLDTGSYTFPYVARSAEAVIGRRDLAA
jgi:hypothetical protein